MHRQAHTQPCTIEGNRREIRLAMILNCCPLPFHCHRPWILECHDLDCGGCCCCYCLCCVDESNRWFVWNCVLIVAPLRWFLVDKFAAPAWPTCGFHCFSFSFLYGKTNEIVLKHCVKQCWFWIWNLDNLHLPDSSDSTSLWTFNSFGTSAVKIRTFSSSITSNRWWIELISCTNHICIWYSGHTD